MALLSEFQEARKDYLKRSLGARSWSKDFSLSFSFSPVRTFLASFFKNKAKSVELKSHKIDSKLELVLIFQVLTHHLR
jgi:hypothetical protein